MRPLFTRQAPKTVRGVDGMTSTEMQTAQALHPKNVLGDRFVFEGERLLDKATCKCYVPERWLMERVNRKLEHAALLAEQSGAWNGADSIRALKESV